MLEVISNRAREEGITTFTALVLAENTEMMSLIQQLGPGRVLDHELGTVEVEVPIPVFGIAPALRKLIRIAARHDVGVPPAAQA